MIGRVITVSKIDGIVQGIISSQDGREYSFSSPSVYVRPGFIIEFDIIELEGKEYAQLIRQAEIEYPELSNDIVQDIIAEVDAIVEQKGFLTAIEFSQLLKGNGVQDVKTYAQNMTGFISKYLAPKYTSRSDVRVNGKICPCAIVSAQASANLSFGKSPMSSQGLDNDTIKKVVSVLTQYIREHGYIKGAYLPELLKQAGINDFHQYAVSIVSFISSFFSNEFRVENNVIIDGKNQPCIILPNNNLDEETLKNTVSIIKQYIEEYGYVKGAYFPALLKKAGILDYHRFAESITAFISLYFNTEFKVETNVYIDGKTQPCIITSVDSRLKAAAIEDMKSELLQIIGERGFADFSLVTGLLEKYNIDASILPSSFSEFVEKELNGLEIQDDVVIGQRYYKRVLLQKGRVDFESFDNYSGELMLPSDIVLSVSETISTIIRDNGYMLSSELPTIFKRFGVDNYKLYADSLAQFVEKYLTNFISKTHAYIGGKDYPAIIIGRGQEISFFSSDDASVLLPLYESGDYYGFLASEHFTKYRPVDIPPFFFIKALTCAKRLLTKDEEAVFTLNSFQKTLLEAPLGTDIVKKYKKGCVIDNTTLEECLATSIPTRTIRLKKDKNNAAKELFNSIGYLAARTHNTDYIGLIERAESCWNELYPYLLFIYIIAKPGRKYEQLNELCRMIKRVNRPQAGSTLTPGSPENWLYLPSIISICEEHNHFDCPPRAFLTQLFSTFVDLNALNEISPISHLFTERAFRFFFEVYNHYDMLTEEDYRTIFDTNINKELYQKIVAQIWEKIGFVDALSPAFLKLLAFTLKYDCEASVDEILRLRVTRGNLTKQEKRLSLLGSYPVIIDLLGSNDVFYGLAVYAKQSFDDISEAVLTVDMKENWGHWRNISDSYYAQRTSDVFPVTEVTSPDLISLFDVFKLDYAHEMELQDAYADWIMGCDIIDSAPDHVEDVLDDLYAIHAYEAFCRIFRHMLNGSPDQTDQQLIIKYIDSLIFLHYYEEALSFVIDNNLQNHILHVTIDICEHCGISEQTRNIFNNAWSLEKALAFTSKYYIANSTYVINTMIVLYCVLNNPFYAIYLYACYKDTLERGHSHIYTQFRRWLGNRFTKVVNDTMTRFSVIEKSFIYLSTEQLIDFLDWCGNLKLPEKIGLSKKQTHSFASNYEYLIKNAKDPQRWRKFFEHITKKPNLNAWKICACANAISYLEMKATPEFTGIVIQMAESQIALTIDEIPFNYLNMICPFLANADSEIIFHRIHDAMIQSDDFKTRITISPITRELNYSVQDFINICANKFNESHEEIYFDLIECIDGQEDLFSLIDMSKLLVYDEGRIAILRHLCKVYDKVKNAFEYRNILRNEHWNALGYVESNLVSVVRFLYGYSDEITQGYIPNWMNQSEHDIIRIKRDIATILSCYPSKKNLFLFDRETYSAPYKMIVYSIIASVLYDQDLYSNYFSCSYAELTAWDAFDIFAFFSYKTYLYQVYHNSDFDLFYIERRYQKALLALCLLGSNHVDEIDDGSIISSMEYFGHKELSYQTKYIPFKQAIMLLVRKSEDLQCTTEMNTMHKLMLFSLLNGDFCELFDECTMHLLSDVECFNPNAMKLVVSEVAYREFNVSTLKYYILHPDKIDYLLKLSEGVSKPVHDVLAYLQMHSDTKSYELLVEVVQSEKASTCVTKILKVPTKDFDQCREMLIPLLASVQLPLRLYEKMYSLSAKGDTSDRYLYVLNYISTEHPQAQTVYRFLHCVQAAISKDAESLAMYFDDLDFDKNLPETWHKSYLALKQYMLSDMSEMFAPPSLDGDSSYRTAKSSKYKFINAVSRMLNIPQPKVTDMEELYAAYRVAEGEKKTELGIQLLMVMSKTNTKRDMPSYLEVAYIVGIEMLQNENRLTPEARIIILADLDSTINVLSISTQRNFYSISKKTMDKLIQEGLDINCWCRYYDLISACISKDDETSKELEIVKAQIIPVLQKVLHKDTSLEQRLITLKSLNIATVFYSRFAGYLQKAVEHEIKQLEKDVRLHIEIVNDSCSDGCIYAQILNVGHSTVNLDNLGDNHVKITLSFNDNPNEIIIGMDNTITELRHGYVSGFCVKLPIQLENLSTVDVTVSAWLNQVLYSRFRKTLQIHHDQESVGISEKKQWYHVDSAVTDEEMLFGRENDKEKLRQSLKEGLTVLYGPSRIGKTSLLNWVRRFLSKQNVTAPNSTAKRIITVLLAGERTFKERDYTIKFYDDTPLDYSNASEVSDYLLCDSIIHSIDKPKRFAVVGEELTQELKKQITSVLSDKKSNLVDRYSNLEELLRKNETELWLLMDEFQEVVRQWKNIESATSAFALVCSDLKISDPEYPHAVRLVLCGSDELLKQMTSTEKSVWRKIIPDTGILVGPLPRDGFRKMICEAEEFPKDLICYSDSAIDALYTYTGGIALYGKEICNTILRKVCRDASSFTNRNTIFSSDITWAVQTLLNRQKHEQTTNVSVVEGIIHIYDAVVKNLDKETDMLFLMYIAQWLRENPSNESFPKSVFTSMHLKDLYATTIGDSIEIAVKRGILCEQRDTNGIVCAYIFTTIFYYYAFLGINKMSCEQIESLLLAAKENVPAKSDTANSAQSHKGAAFRESFKQMESSDQAFWLGGLLTMSTPEAKEALKSIIADVYHVSESVFNNGTGDVHTSTINITVVSEAVKTLHDTILYGRTNGKRREEIVDICRNYISKIPLLTPIDPIPELTKEKETELLESSDRDEAYCEQLSEGVIESGIDLTEWIERGEGAVYLFDNYGVTVESQSIVVGAERHTYDEKHYNSIVVGFYLRWLFKKISTFSPDVISDYSPSSIMFCKTIERLLKEKHLPLYRNHAIWKNNVFSNGSNPSIVRFPQKATIGTFTTAMATMFEISATDSEATRKRENRDLFLSHTHAPESDWFQYYQRMKNVLDVRNKTAHSNQVSQSECDDVIHALFGDNLLSHTVDFV